MIGVTDEAGVRVVTLDRPERRNALTPDALDRLERAITTAEAPILRLRGAGSAFCAGADLDDVDDLDRESAEAFAGRGQRVGNAIEDSESVVVAEIDGAARGGGVEIALACDLRIGTPRATFAEPGVEFGLFGAWGGTRRLPRILGLGDALDLALSGRVLDSEAALRIGLVSRIVEEPATVADGLAANDSAALRTLKERLRDDAPRTVADRREAAAFADLVADADVGTPG